jgi:hypothetical protein
MMMSKVGKYFFNILVALDQLGNTLLGGDPDETISSRSGKNENRKRWAYFLCRALHWIDADHCKKSIEEDEGKNAIIK